MLTYSQSAQRQGLDIAIDGVPVDQADPAFVSLRETSTAVYQRSTSETVGNVQVAVGRGIVRLELRGAEPDAGMRSPVVVVATLAELKNPSFAAQNAVRTAAASGRALGLDDVREGFARGAQLARAAANRRTIVLAIAGVITAALVIGFIVIAVQQAGATGTTQS